MTQPAGPRRPGDRRGQGNGLGTGRRRCRKTCVDRDQVTADAGGRAVSGKIEDRDISRGGLLGEGADPRAQLADGGVLAQIDVEAEAGESCGNVLGVVDRRAKPWRIRVARISNDEGDTAAGGFCFRAKQEPDGNEQCQPAQDEVASLSGCLNSRCLNGAAASPSRDR
jgi:hypothetical protein